MGRPDLGVPLDVRDGVGTFHIANVPNSVSAIVLYDGAPRLRGDPPVPDGRAELVPVHVSGGAITTIPDRFGARAVLSSTDESLRMPLAGTVLAAAVPEGGATPWQPTFDLPQTVHANLAPSSGGTFTVWPLPAGRFDVAARLPGFVQGGRAVNVVAGQTMAAPVALQVDLGAPAPGCGSVSASAPSRCENGLVCEPSDGRCYECTAGDASLCPSGLCDAAVHLCKPPASAASTICSPCTSDAGCANPSVPMSCQISSGATSGYCTIGCSSSSDCPAGFGCSDAHLCRPPAGCGAWLQTMASPCYSSEHCGDALHDGWCAGGSSSIAGYCTASCSADADCAVGTMTSLVCQLGPYGASTRLQCRAR
ncbi:MAG TPA: hypothetical protein VLT61_06465 [Anaeromyxobacteraceae bacterium]|nr:hypothetical protein [Anaeromyxobacteraceae bacterium]